MATVTTSDPAALQARLEELVKDEAFVRSLLETEDPADVQKALAEKGVSLTEEELIQIHDALARAAENGGELTEDDLEEVAGGLGLIGIGICLGIFFAALVGSMIWGMVDMRRGGW